MKKQELIDSMKAHLHNMILDRHIEPESVKHIVPYVEELLSARDEAIVSALAQLIRDWEEAMGDDDKSLYTLGMRRAIDVIREEKYKPLDKDYRNNSSSEQ